MSSYQDLIQVLTNDSDIVGSGTNMQVSFLAPFSPVNEDAS